MEQGSSGNISFALKHGCKSDQVVVYDANNKWTCTNQTETTVSKQEIAKKRAIENAPYNELSTDAIVAATTALTSLSKEDLPVITTNKEKIDQKLFHPRNKPKLKAPKTFKTTIRPLKHCLPTRIFSRKRKTRLNASRPSIETNNVGRRCKKVKNKQTTQFKCIYDKYSPTAVQNRDQLLSPTPFSQIHSLSTIKYNYETVPTLQTDISSNSSHVGPVYTPIIVMALVALVLVSKLVIMSVFLYKKCRSWRNKSKNNKKRNVIIPYDVIRNYTYEVKQWYKKYQEPDNVKQELMVRKNYRQQRNSEYCSTKSFICDRW